VKNALKVVSGLDIKLICPSHGLIWKSYIPKIAQQYQKGSNYESDNKALIVYDSMWGSTKKMAQSLEKGLYESGIEVTVKNLKNNHISDVVTEVLRSRLVLIGSPTLNNGILPTLGEFLTYLKGLRPRKRIGFSFGSFGWGGQAAGEIEKVLKELKWDLPFEPVKIKYIPDEEELHAVENTGKKLGDYINK